jgi:hypothetical protein
LQTDKNLSEEIMMNKTLLILILGYASIFPQDLDSLDYSDILQENSFSSEISSDAIEYLESLTLNPVNINTAVINELLTIPYLSPVEAVKIIEFRQATGFFFSTSELFMIKELSAETIRRIKPFITVSVPKKNLHYPPELFIRSRIKDNSLFSKGTANWRSLNRVALKIYDNFSTGLIIEKDEGEKIFSDFSSGFLMITDQLYIDKLVIGDYFLESGAGLVFWGPSGLPKANGINSARKSARGLIAYNSTNESCYLRGVAIQKRIKSLDLFLFFSRKYYDGLTDTSGKVFKLINTGYHRSDLEKERKNNISSNSIGGSINFSSKYLNTGFSYYMAGFKPSCTGKNSIKGYSLSFSSNFDKLYFFGEAAYSNSMAFVFGFNIHLIKEIEFLTVFRNYQPGYFNIYGVYFGEYPGSVSDETGFFSALKIYFLKGELDFYFDQVNSPASENKNEKGGFEILSSYRVPVSKNLIFSIKYKMNNRDVVVNNGYLNSIGIKVRQNYRAQLDIKSGSFLLKTRGEYSSLIIINDLHEKGLMIMQDIKLSLKDLLQISFRTCFFKTDSFNSGIYEYEAGVPGIIENKMLYGEGVRLYGTIGITVSDKMKIHLKYGKTFRKNESGVISNADILIQTDINY